MISSIASQAFVYQGCLYRAGIRISCREKAFRVTPAVTKVDSLLRATSVVFAPFKMENDSESLSALKSNMGDREIVFFKLTDYLYVLHPSMGKISRPTLQNLLRMILDLKKGRSFTLVVSNVKIYSLGKSY